MKELYKKLAAIHSAANWFYWLGAMSLVSAFLKHFFNTDLSYLFGLGLGNLLDSLSLGLEKSFFSAFTIVLHVFLVFFLFFIAKQAKERHKWAFIAGLIFLCIDTTIFPFFSGNLLSFGFRLIVIGIIFIRGFLNLDKTKTLAKEMQTRLSEQWENEGLEVEMEELN